MNSTTATSRAQSFLGCRMPALLVLALLLAPSDAFLVAPGQSIKGARLTTSRLFMAEKKPSPKKSSAKSVSRKTPAQAKASPKARATKATAKETATPAAATTTETTAATIPTTPTTATTATTAASIAVPPAIPDLVKTYHRPRPGIDSSFLGDLTGGRPGAIVETEEQLERKQEIFDELDSGKRDHYDAQKMMDYGTLEDELNIPYDIDDPDALDQATLGSWTIRDLQSKFPYEWDPDSGEPDPNQLELEKPGMRFKKGIDLDEDGIELMYDSLYGSCNPQDERTILGAMESYMINEKTRDEAMLPRQFPEGDLEIGFNEDLVKFRKSLDIIETYTDEFLPPEIQLPRHVAKWHGYPEPMSYPAQKETNNLFLEDTPNPTDWSKLDPYRARRKAIELARAQNADWLPPGKSQAWHAAKREPYEKVGTLVGTLRPGKIDETIRENIKPALDILGSVVELLSIEGEDQTVFRFHYHGLMKHRHGMTAFTETLIRDCGVEVTGVVMETGFRRRDRAYEGGDCWYPPAT